MHQTSNNIMSSEKILLPFYAHITHPIISDKPHTQISLHFLIYFSRKMSLFSWPVKIYHLIVYSFIFMCPYFDTYMYMYYSVYML